tara:strand:+ start:295 stop:1962 length:1668 start_codon:yes stop_codon:yes gene_type:complete
MVDNTEIWTGANSHLTFVPESDFFLGYAGDTTLLYTANTAVSSGTYSGLYRLGLDELEVTSSGAKVNSVRKLVTGLYSGCIADFYTNGHVLKHSLVIADNDAEAIYFHTDFIHAALDNAAAYVVIRKYGCPVVGPLNSSQPTLLADNWLGLVETATFPNVEVELKQLNLQIGGSRNWTHQYKGIETASGANVALMANHGAWLYYALGQCSNLSVEQTDDASVANTTSNFVQGDTDNNYDRYLLNNDGATGTTTFASQGPIFYRVPKGKTDICPPLVGSQQTDGAYNYLDKLTRSIINTDGSNNIQYPIQYTFSEVNGAILPSFTLEQTFFKSGEDANPYSVDADDQVWTRIATGNVVNTLTLTANENEELKMTMDCISKAVYEAPASYKPLAGKTFTSVGDLQNKSTVESFTTPFMFFDGSISLFGQQYLKISNMSLTINNNLQQKRYVGNYDRKSQSVVPAQRDYELTFTGFVTDKTLFTELLNQTEHTTTDNIIDLQFTKDNGEEIRIKFDDYMLTTNTWTIPDDKGPISVEWTIKPRSLSSCVVNTHWVLQG